MTNRKLKISHIGQNRVLYLGSNFLKRHLKGDMMRDEEDMMRYKGDMMRDFPGSLCDVEMFSNHSKCVSNGEGGGALGTQGFPPLPSKHSLKL